MGFNPFTVAGGIGQGITAGTQDIRSQREQEQLAALRQYQLNDLQQKQDVQNQVKGLPKVGEVIASTPGQTLSSASREAGVTRLPGADAEREGGTGVAPKAGITTTYRPSDQAADIASIYSKNGMIPEGAQMNAQAYALKKQEYTDDVLNLVKQSRSMPLEDYANAATRLFTGNPTQQGAYIQPPNGSGQLWATVHKPTGETASVPIASHDQIDHLLMASTSPTAWNQEQQYQTSNAGLGIQGRMAGAAETQAAAATTSAGAAKQHAETDAGRLNQEVANNTFGAAADYHRAQAQAARTTAPAIAAMHNAMAEQAKAHGEYWASRATDFEGKLPQGEQMLLGVLKQNALQAGKAAADGAPGAAQYQASTMYKLYRHYQSLGQSTGDASMANLDPYSMANVPLPEAAAAQFAATKPSAQKVAQATSAMRQNFDDDYANRFQAAITPNMASGQINRGSGSSGLNLPDLRYSGPTVGSGAYSLPSPSGLGIQRGPYFPFGSSSQPTPPQQVPPTGP